METLNKSSHHTIKIGTDCCFLFAYCALIAWLSSRSISTVSLNYFPHQDKLIHFGAYFVMCVFTWRCFRHFISNRNSLMISSILFCSFYGITDEIHQSFTPNRVMDIYDWVADSVGALIAGIGLFKLNKQ